MREGLHKIVSFDETIVAISTPLGRSAIGVVRISGNAAVHITGQLFRSSAPLVHHRVSVGKWSDPEGNALDEVVVTFSRAPHSYTGEDLVEISAHGNPVILGRIVQAIRECGARLATPGEFTWRAVANGKLDLIQAEAVREFIEAQTEQQARVALRQIEGAISRRIGPAQRDLIDVIAHLEAGIDFAEDDVDLPESDFLTARLVPVIESLNALHQTFGYGRMLVEGLRLTIVGKPNVGKSSLFNRLVSSERAIVTDVPGTTRDVLTEAVNLEGIPLRLADTAGLRETSDKVERIGVGRTLEAVTESDLLLVILDGSKPLDSEDARVLGKIELLPHLIVINKCDLPQVLDLHSNGAIAPVNVSATVGTGLDKLRVAIRAFLMTRKTDLADDSVLTNARQNEALMRAVESLKAASAAVIAKVPHEMILLDLYSALAALNELTGDVVTEDILDRIFSTFCIGK
jgi:tRNA modification GTPase